MTDKEAAIYQWIEACPEACQSYVNDDNNIVIEVEVNEEEDN